MSTKMLVSRSSLTAIGAAIRSKNKSTDTYLPSEMGPAIEALEDPSVLTTKAITANGSYDAADDEADGYSLVTVNVPNNYTSADEGKVVSSGALVAQTSTTVTQNGTVDTTTNNSVVVNVSGDTPALVTKTITANGTYSAVDDSADGYSEVTVNVSGGGGAEDPFVESQATAIFDTHIAGNATYGIELEFMPITVASDYQWYVGSDNNVFTIASMAAAQGVTAGFIRCGNVDFGVITLLKGRKNTIECKNGTVTVNGTQLSGSYSGAVSSGSTSIKIFGRSSSESRAHARVYRCALFDSNGDKVHEYFPAADSDFIPCLHDAVAESYLYGSNNKLTYGKG